MKIYSVFDILGPIMIGPSSSHTAGAARLGKVASVIAGGEFNSVTFYLHGSFGKTYKGHGTDKALVAGILGMDTHDERIKYSFKIAEEKGIKIEFVEEDLGDEHPNTVKMVFHKNNGTDFYVTGSSIGGGNIIITNINGNKVEFSGAYPTIIVKHKDTKGVLGKVLTIISNHGNNLASLKLTRSEKGKDALALIETDTFIDEDLADEVRNVENVISVNTINPA